jgi:hypothetical protein
MAVEKNHSVCDTGGLFSFGSHTKHMILQVHISYALDITTLPSVRVTCKVPASC